MQIIDAIDAIKGSNIEYAARFFSQSQQWSYEKLCHVLRQHSRWVDEATHLFLTARMRVDK